MASEGAGYLLEGAPLGTDKLDTQTISFRALEAASDLPRLALFDCSSVTASPPELRRNAKQDDF